MKEKTTTTSTVSSVSAALGKNSGAVSSTIKTPIKLDKLPSLPSLPMFEPQRKEFKSKFLLPYNNCLPIYLRFFWNNKEVYSLGLLFSSPEQK